MSDRVVNINGCQYILRKFGIEEKIEIRNNTLDAAGNFKLGTFQLKMLAASLVSWDVKDRNGKLIPPNEENIKRFLNPDHFDRLVAEAIELNSISDDEKKTLLQGPVGLSDGGNSTITNKNSDTPTETKTAE